MQYVKSAKAGTDVPSTVPEFISQRRRWSMGTLRRRQVWTRADGGYSSIFAATYAMVSFWRIWTSGHGFIRKINLMILIVYSELNNECISACEVLIGGRSDQPDLQYLIRLFILLGLLLLDRLVNIRWYGPVWGSWRGDFSNLQQAVYRSDVRTRTKMRCRWLIIYSFVVIVCSLGNRPQGSNWLYTIWSAPSHSEES